MGTLERKERDRQEMRKLILETAKKLFTEEGFEQVSMRRIADTIEYSVGTLYLYFKDKADILYALEEIGFNELYQRQLKLDLIAEPLARLYAHAQMFISFAQQNLEYYNLMFNLSGPAKQIKENQDWDLGKRSYAVLKDHVKACLEADVFKDKNVTAETAAFAIFSAISGMAALVTQPHAVLIPSGQTEATIKASLDFIFDSLVK